METKTLYVNHNVQWMGLRVTLPDLKSALKHQRVKVPVAFLVAFSSS